MDLLAQQDLWERQRASAVILPAQQCSLSSRRPLSCCQLAAALPPSLVASDMDRESNRFIAHDHAAGPGLRMRLGTRAADTRLHAKIRRKTAQGRPRTSRGRFKHPSARLRVEVIMDVLLLKKKHLVTRRGIHPL